jgi:CubicO group peptidase (beta-lactamase class C family)
VFDDWKACFTRNRLLYGAAYMTKIRTQPLVLWVTRAITGLVLLGLVAAPAVVRADPVDDYVAAKMAAKSIPGLVLAVIRDGRVVKQRAYGYANLELKVPATLDTSFILASTTKVFTAAAIMQLVEQGKITRFGASRSPAGI